MLFASVGLLLAALPARAGEPVGAPEAAPAEPVAAPAPEVEAGAASAPPAEATPEEILAAARRAYLAGRPAEARDMLQALWKLGSALPTPVRRGMYAWLGDIAYNEQGRSAAEPYFRLLLDEDPTYILDPLDHPPGVTQFFDELRPAPTPLDVTVVPKPRPRPPWLSLAPGGVYYFARGKVGPGLAVAGVQTALLVTNLVLYTEISGIDSVKRGSPEADQWRSLRLATDLTAGALYLSLVLPPAIELGRWGVENPKVAVGISPGAVAVRGTF